ncbi:hypothetical protein LIX31_11235 [Leptospira kirschneri]|nr:hypothetical protein [Leptospira kirschneri]WBF93595.1 hypothetical protein LIX31_11235 [Leptospira kirschneri]
MNPFLRVQIYKVSKLEVREMSNLQNFRETLNIRISSGIYKGLFLNSLKERSSFYDEIKFINDSFSFYNLFQKYTTHLKPNKIIKRTFEKDFYIF